MIVEDGSGALSGPLIGTGTREGTSGAETALDMPRVVMVPPANETSPCPSTQIPSDRSSLLGEEGTSMTGERASKVVDK